MSMRKPIINPFDTFVENLIREFSKIPNFQLVSTDSDENHALNMISFRVADLSAYKELVCHHFVPAANRVIADTKKLVHSSKCRSLVKIRDTGFEETMYDTIRLAYVSVYHKLESFVRDVLTMTEDLFAELFENERIRITVKEFKADCELLIKFYPMYLQIMQLFVNHRMVSEAIDGSEQFPDVHEKGRASRDQLEEGIRKCVASLKEDVEFQYSSPREM